MRRVIVGLSVVGMSAMLASCGGADSEGSEGDPPTETVTVTVTAEADSQQEASTDSASTEPEEPSATDGEDAATATEASADSDRDFGAGETSDRGYIKKELGQWAGIGSQDDRVVDFRLTAIETDFACDEPYADRPANGQFVALTFEIETYPSLAEDEYLGDFTITEHDIVMFDEAGKRENDSTGNGYMCLDEQDKLPMMIGPGQTAEGKIVIDTGVQEGTLAVESYFLGGPGGWEWAFPGTGG